MATIDNYTIDIKVKGEQDIKNVATSVEKLGGQVKNLGESFEKASGKAETLAIAIAGIGLTEYIHKIMESASVTKDLSEAYGLTISSVLELEKGFAKAGRGADDMSKMMTVLNMKALEVADGNLATENSFNELGITFNDLKTKSMDQIFLMIAKSMEEGKGSAKTLAAAMDVLGKGAKGVPWGDFVEGMEKAQGKMGANAEAVETLDKTMKNLEASAGAIKREFTLLIAPMADVFNKFTEGSDNARAAAIALGSAMAIISGAVVAKGITLVVDAFKEFAAMTGLSSAATATETAALTANTAATAQNAAIRSAGLAAKVASLESSIANARAILAETAAMEGNIIMTAEMSAARRILMIQSSQLAAAESMLAEATATTTAAMAAEATAAGTAATATTAFGAAVGFVMKNLGPIAIAITAIVAAYEAWDYYNQKDKAAENAEKTADALKKQSEANKPVLDDEAKKIDLQAAANVALRNQYEAQTLLLNQTEKRLKLQLSLVGSSDLEKTAALANYDAQAKKQQEILKLSQEIERVETQAKNDKDGAGKYAGQLTILRNQLEIVKGQVDKTAELTTQIKKAEIAEGNRLAMLGIQQKASDELLKVQYEMNQLTMTGDQQKLSSLQQQIELEGRAEVRRRQALLGKDQVLPWEEQKRVMDEVAEKYKPLLEATDQLIQKSRQFTTGWDSAFNQAMDDATNAAKIGRDSFNAVFNNMNSAIDTFVMTGKFKFSSFATSIIQDLLKVELKASAMKLWGAMGMGGASGGGIVSGLSKMFGFAEGGDPPTDKPSIVGEKGPEVFIPKSAGTILNQKQLAMMSGGMGGDTINHNTYVTNNVSAIDGQSVARLFTQNRQLLLGATEQARKEVPGGSYRGR